MHTGREPFFRRLAGIFNSEQSRSVILCGNVYDLFDAGDEYLPLIPFLAGKIAKRRPDPDRLRTERSDPHSGRPGQAEECLDFLEGRVSTSTRC